MLSSSVDGVPNWVSRGAGTGDIRSKPAESATDEHGFLRLPPIARNPHKAVQDYIDVRRTGRERRMTKRKTKGIVEAIPLDDASLVAYVKHDKNDKDLLEYAEASEAAAQRHNAVHRQIAIERKHQRNMHLQRTFSNRAGWKLQERQTGYMEQVNQNLRQERKRLEHEAKMEQLERAGAGGSKTARVDRSNKRSADSSTNGTVTPPSVSARGGGVVPSLPKDDANNHVSPYAKPLTALVHSPRTTSPSSSSLVKQRSGSRSPPKSTTPGKKQQQQGVLVADASTTSKTNSHSGFGALDPDAPDSPNYHELQAAHAASDSLQTQDQKEASLTSLPDLHTTSPGQNNSGSLGDSPKPHVIRQPKAVILLQTENSMLSVESHNDREGDEDATSVVPSELTLTYIRMLEKNEGYQRRNVARSFTEGLKSMEPTRHRFLAQLSALYRERASVELAQELAREKGLQREYVKESAALEQAMHQDWLFAQYHEQQRPSCTVLPRPGGHMSIDTHHSTTYVVEWRHRSTVELDLIATLLDDQNRIIGTASKNNTVRSREGVTCVRPFSSASPSLVRLGPVTHRSCLQVCLVTLPPQTRHVLFSVVVPWRKLIVGGRSHVTHATGDFQGFCDIGRGWLTVFDALPLVQTVGSHLKPSEAPLLDEVCTVELQPTADMRSCVAMTLGGFYLNQAAKTPASFHAYNDRYVGGKSIVDTISSFCKAWRDDPMEELVQEMEHARLSLLQPFLALYETFYREQIELMEQEGDVAFRRHQLNSVSASPSPPDGAAAGPGIAMSSHSSRNDVSADEDLDDVGEPAASLNGTMRSTTSESDTLLTSGGAEGGYMQRRGSTLSSVSAYHRSTDGSMRQQQQHAKRSPRVLSGRRAIVCAFEEELCAIVTRLAEIELSKTASLVL